jgi:hypothetical protein
MKKTPERDHYLETLNKLSLEKFGISASEWPDGLHTFQDRLRLSPQQMIDSVTIDQILFDGF